MRAFGAGSGRRLRERWRLPGAIRGQALPLWVAGWRASLNQTPVAQWLAAFSRSPFALWFLSHWKIPAEVCLYIGSYLVYVFSRGLFYENVRKSAFSTASA